MNKTIVPAILLFASSSLSAADQQILLDFQDVADIAVPATSFIFTQGPILPPTQGFVFAREDGSENIAYTVNETENGNQYGVSWTSVLSPSIINVVTMQREDGSPFTLQQFVNVDIGVLRNEVVNVTGYRVDGTILTRQISGPGVSDPDAGFVEVTFVDLVPDWNDVVQVTFENDIGGRTIGGILTCVDMDSAKASDIKKSKLPGNFKKENKC